MSGRACGRANRIIIVLESGAWAGVYVRPCRACGCVRVYVCGSHFDCVCSMCACMCVCLYMCLFFSQFPQCASSYCSAHFVRALVKIRVKNLFPLLIYCVISATWTHTKISKKFNTKNFTKIKWETIGDHRTQWGGVCKQQEADVKKKRRKQQ